jgi:hypothetical protein
LFDIARRRDRKIVSPQVDDARIAAMVRQREPQLAIDGEFQADATLVPGQVSPPSLMTSWAVKALGPYLRVRPTIVPLGTTPP